ncbi:MAG: DUF89 family protein [Anaerolineaceae bacterium]|nr:DUF89 family protein [Anaerolineaceae bacterium]
MKTSLDCVSCILRQTLDAARMVSGDPAVHEKFLRDALGLAKEMDLNQSPPAMAQRLHRHLREESGVDDPYRETKDQQNFMALNMIPSLRSSIKSSNDPLLLATRLAIAGNVIDMGANGNLTKTDVLQAINVALSEPLVGEFDEFRKAIAKAQSILYLADNAGEIAFDRLLIEMLLPERVTLAVRGAPVSNDATFVDAQAVGLDRIVETIDNGSDAPGTLLSDCSAEFRHRFTSADLIIVKGQGNFETLNNESENPFFLFKVKCPLVADLVNQPIHTQILLQNRSGKNELKN